MSKDTRFELVEELQKLNRPDLKYLIEEAKAGEFHDFYNEKYPAPKMALVQKLKEKGLDDIAERVIGGEFDE
jgi:hypothetical protein